ncbi:ABC transporter ATP-binding protein [Pseudoalteromonas luteoviolacea]|uniref:ABC transporter ATP-binding protein n=1 Tax=Pseudoalteromonas luteoviolacea TaxID=43657 RepID=UPI001B3A0D21|nr:ABC transporter ATP-binding protein [Pseudoalteromonas luteoviolacea]MBQ4877957.1 ABC transporter ATP-binding protein [Pseudoalteromonas luteoviolacea]MBQ4906992.1 ABC transporter ATP-binding protein [Pseudoalteromonas luteoviolacea]
MRDEPYDTEEIKSPWLVLRQICAPHKATLIMAMSLIALVSGLQLLPVYLLFLSLNEILMPVIASAEKLMWLGAGLVAVVLGRTFCLTGAYYLSHQMAFKTLTEVRLELANNLASLSLKWLNKQNSAALKQQCLQDVEKLENFIAHQSVELLNACLTPLCILFALFMIDWRLALSAIAVVPVAFFVSTFFMRKTAQHYAQFSEAETALNTTLSDYVKYAPLMKLYNLDSQRFAILNNKLNNYQQVVHEVTKQTAPGWALYTALLSSAFIFLLPCTIWLQSSGQITLSHSLLAFLLAVGMLGPVVKVSRFFMEVNDLLASIQRITPLFSIESTHRDDAPIQVNLKYPMLQFYCVDFGYEQHRVLSNVHFKLLPNAINVVVGGSGGGKSTLAMLACGLLAPSAGRVQLYGQDVFGLSDSARAQAMSVVTQDSYLFEGTVRDNIIFGRSGISTETLEHAVVAAQLKPWLQLQREGLETPVSARGANLSGGEKMRIAIARALLVAPPLVILDEASAAMDNLTHSKFYQGLKGHYPNTTFLVITHKYFGLESSDQIFSLVDGEIVAQGDHESLLVRCEHYQKGWQLQGGDCASTPHFTPAPILSYEN